VSDHRLQKRRNNGLNAGLKLVTGHLFDICSKYHFLLVAAEVLREGEIFGSVVFHAPLIQVVAVAPKL
jgi:hypothetical protein